MNQRHKRVSCSPLIDPAVCAVVLVVPSQQDLASMSPHLRDSHHRKLAAVVTAANIVNVPVFVSSQSSNDGKHALAQQLPRASSHHEFISDEHAFPWLNPAFVEALDRAAPVPREPAPPPRQPFLPDPWNRISVPAYPSRVARYAVVGIVAPHHRNQMGVLLRDRLVSVFPAPLADRRQRAGVTALRRYLAHDILAVLRLAPYVAEAEKGERRAIRFRNRTS